MPRPQLRGVSIELTERCNNACIHCSINQAEDDLALKAIEMNTNFIKQILDEIIKFGCLDIRFTGGEPLLRKDFSELYTYARNLGMRVHISTNARLVSQELAELFAYIPPKSPIDISVYGMHAKTYDATTKMNGAFDEFSRGLDYLKQYKIPFQLKFLVVPQTKHEITEYNSFTQALGISNSLHRYINNFELRGRHDNPIKDRIIQHLRWSTEELLNLRVKDPEVYFSDMRTFAGSKFMGPIGNQLFNCGGKTLHIDAYGNAQFCLLLRHPDTIYPLDSAIHQRNHPDTTLSPLQFVFYKFLPKIQKMTAKNPDYLRRCAICFLKGLCEQCPGKSWTENRSLDTPVEYLCNLAHAEAVFVGLLKEGEKSWELSKEIWQKRLRKFVSSPKTVPGLKDES
jgi:MoaA/NifB/PqqE/SkfB family radical SAM enzyme